jgi:hypothetical protein
LLAVTTVGEHNLSWLKFVSMPAFRRHHNQLPLGRHSRSQTGCQNTIFLA